MNSLTVATCYCELTVGSSSSILVAPKKVLNEERAMLDITKDIQSLTTFRRRSGDFMKQLRKNRRPVVLTVRGKAAAVVQDAEAYQRLLDIAAQAARFSD